MRKILNLYLARANTPYSEAYADLDLPASPYELLDVLDKLRLDEGEAPYLQINEYYDFEELAPLLSGDAGFYELNALVQKLSELDERQQVSFEGLVQMEVNKKQGFIPMSRLIANSADSTPKTALCQRLNIFRIRCLNCWTLKESGARPESANAVCSLNRAMWYSIRS